MDLITTFGLALALALDAFAVATGVSTLLGRVSMRQYFRLAWHFGLFQFLMPILGWLLGHWAAAFLDQFAHWIAFVILGYLGVRMIRDARRKDSSGDTRTAPDPTRGISLVMLSLATSIDAFAVGLSYAMLGEVIFAASAIIGLTACVMTLVGMYCGHLLSRHIGSYANVAGGCVLIALGIKILTENLVA